jgi:hypothetical protein
MVEPAGPGAAAEGSKREPMIDELMKAIHAAGRGVMGGALASVRMLLPLIEVYAGVRAGEREGGDRAGRFGLKRGEEDVLQEAGEKAFLELLEIASRTNPIYKDAPPFDAIGADGSRQTPHLRHLLALVAAAAQYFARDDDRDKPEPQPAIPAHQTVVFMAVAPGEYAVHTGPISPREMRRNAMRQRSYNPPRAAVMRSAANARHVEIGPAGAPMAARKSMAAAPAYRCVCGGPVDAYGCCSRCGPVKRAFSPARYNEDKSCKDPLTISCETRWRVRECFKWAFCDLLRCLGEELCGEDGKIAPSPDLERCLESFVCSIITCLPDAICPPPEKTCCEVPREAVCAPQCAPRLPAPGCDCNYAVGE